MNTKTMEYTPGQLIRFEATSLYHNALRLRGIVGGNSPELDLLLQPAEQAAKSVRVNLEGQFDGINRQEQHYNNLINLLERSREELEKRPVSEQSHEAWLLLNQCRYHSMTILSMMQKQSKVAGASR